MNFWTSHLLRAIALLLPPAVVALTGCGMIEDETAATTIRGEARLPDGSRFPDHGTLEIALVNTLLADTPDAVVARHSVDDPSGTFTAFEFPVDGDVIEDGMVYALSATYRDNDDKVWFVTDSQVTIEPQAGRINDLNLIAVAREPAAEPAPAPVEGPVQTSFLCAGTPVAVTYESGNVTLRFEGEEEPLVLPTAISASGARFAQDGNEFWSKGNEATLIRTGQPSITCLEQTKPAPAVAEPPVSGAG